MAQEITFYTILGVAEDADAKTIKAAYRQMSETYNPDVCFKSINDAWAQLEDPEKRRKYDDALRRTREATTPEKEIVPPDWSWSPPAEEYVYANRVMWYESWRMWTCIAVAILISLTVLGIVFTMGNADKPTAESVASSSRPPTTPSSARSKVSAPVFSPQARKITEPTAIRVSCDTYKASVYYTADGKLPTREDRLWSGTVMVAPGTTLRARAFYDGMKPSEIVEAIYERDSVVLTDVISIRSSAAMAWKSVQNYDRGQGFAAKIDNCSRLYDQANELYRLEAYAAGRTLYMQVLSQCKALKTLDSTRETARSSREKAAIAIKSVPDFGSSKAWKPVVVTAIKARMTFESGEFPQAYELWGKVVVQIAERQKAMGPQAGQADRTLTLNLGKGVTMKLVRIPAGKFIMGSPSAEEGRRSDEGPQRQVTISKPFHIGVYEVTQTQYESVTGRNYSREKGPHNPAGMVSWKDATEFCRALSKKTGRDVRLPTEAQWEYACRAGTNTRYSFGKTDKDFDAYGWRKDNSGGKSHPVGQKKPNPSGLYDMHGNVWEWCRDWYNSGFYAKATNVDPENTTESGLHIIRGGSVGWGSDHARSALHNRERPGSRFHDVGLRVVVVGAAGEALHN